MWAVVKDCAVPLAICAALWIASHPYFGIVGDSRLYIGRILADLDPAGVGQDMAFVHDGQFQFSPFPFLVRGLVAQLGPALAAELVAAIGCLCWFFATLAFAMQLARGRALWMMLAFVCVLPHSYGNHLLVTAETLAVSRPFAEAAALAGFAMLIAGRPLFALALTLLAFVMHPLVALPCLFVIAAVHLRDRRVILALLAVASFVPIAGWIGVPLFDRIFVHVDAEWFDLLYQLNPYLFPSHWSLAAFGPLATEAATIAIAASLLLGAARRIFVSSLVVGVCGVLIARLFGDVLHNLLAIQVQTWRAAWVMAAVAQYAYALCAIRLSAGTLDVGRRRVTLALLTLGWFGNLNLFLAAAVGSLALALHFGRFTKAIPSRHVLLVWTAVAFLVVLSYAGVLTTFLQFLAHMPSGAALGVLYGVRMDVAALPICLLAFAWWVTKSPSLRLSPLFNSVGVFVCAALAAVIWSSRSQAGRDVETVRSPKEFQAVLDSRPGEILWIGTKSEAWQVFGRPQWVSEQQSASIVFSRPLAMLWRQRAQILLDNGLVPSNVFTPWRAIDDSAVPRVTREALQRICAREDAPVAIIFPMEAGESPPPDVSVATWTLPHVRFVPDRNEKNIWHAIDRYAAVACGESSNANDKERESNPPALRGGLL
jgi:hypothetical protein